MHNTKQIKIPNFYESSAVKYDNIIVVREYFGRWHCGAVVTDEDFLEKDQSYLEVPESVRYFPRFREFTK